MKEVTLTMTVQITAIENMTDEEFERWREKRDGLIEEFAAAIELELDLDDVLVLDSKDFVREVEEA